MSRASSPLAAFSLIEVALALGVAAFCLIAIFGLLPVGLNSNRMSIEQTAANGIISAVAADLRATPVTVPRGQVATSQQFQIPIPANPVSSPVPKTLYFSADNQCASSLNGTNKADGTSWSPSLQTRYRLTITFLKNGGAKSATFADLKVSWPAPVDPSARVPAGSVDMFLALDRN
jgi:uncharacterized protein (TIGR02598 family)